MWRITQPSGPKAVAMVSFGIVLVDGPGDDLGGRGRFEPLADVAQIGEVVVGRLRHAAGHRRRRSGAAVGSASSGPESPQQGGGSSLGSGDGIVLGSICCLGKLIDLHRGRSDRNYYTYVANLSQLSRATVSYRRRGRGIFSL